MGYRGYPNLWRIYLLWIIFVRNAYCPRNIKVLDTAVSDESIQINDTRDEDDKDRGKLNEHAYDASDDKLLEPTKKEPDYNGRPASSTPTYEYGQSYLFEKENSHEKGLENNKFRERFQMKFLDTMLRDYDQRAWPTYGSKSPTVVLVNIYINTIGSVSAADMDYNMDIYLRQSWIDPRLALSRFGMNKSVVLNGEYVISRIWRPDLYFRNVKEAKFQAVSNPNLLIKLGLHGEVLYSTRLALKLSCQMYFQNYPLDKQQCQVVMGSSSYTSEIVRLSWMNRAIILDHRMEIPDYYLSEVIKSRPYLQNFVITVGYDVGVLLYKWNENCPLSTVLRDIESVPAGFQPSVIYAKLLDDSFLNATFTIQRLNGFHLVNTYLPTFLIVTISWVSFWLNVDATPARTTLGVTTLLTLTTVASGIRRQIPPVSYVKAVDIWIGVCSVMVFGALLEFAMVNYISRCKLGNLPNCSLELFNVFRWVKTMESQIRPLEGAPQETTDVAAKEEKSRRERNLKRATKLDRMSRYTFPSVFLCFNLIYWFYYLYLAQ